MAGPRFQRHRSPGMPRSDFQIQSPRGPSLSQRTRGCSCVTQNQQAPLQALQEKFATRPWAPGGFISFYCHGNIFLLQGSLAA